MELEKKHHSFIQTFKKALWYSDNKNNEAIVYAVLDGASSTDILPMLKRSSLRYNCLYDGKLSYELALSSPYLVRLEQDNDFTHDLLEKGLGNNWCIFLKTFKPVTMLTVLRQAKHNHKILPPSGKTLIFRYFDPRIIRNYLPVCTIEEANIFWGPVDEIICDGNERHSFNRFTRTDHGVLDLESISINDRNIKKLNYNVRSAELIDLKISQEQLEILGKSKLPAFFKRANEYVIKEFPEFASQSNGTLNSWIEETYNQAIHYGLKTERDHFKFINYKCIFGNDFMEAYKFAKPIMQSNITPGLKLAKLKDAFMEQLNS